MPPLPEPFDRMLAFVGVLIGVALGWSALYFIRRAKSNDPLRGHDTFPLRGRWLMWLLGVGLLLASVWLVGLCLFVLVVLPGMACSALRFNGEGVLWVQNTGKKIEVWKPYVARFLASTIFVGLLVWGLLPMEYAVRSPDGKLVARNYSAGLLVQAISSYAPSHFPHPTSRYRAELQDTQTDERLKLFSGDHGGFLIFVADVSDIGWDPGSKKVSFTGDLGDGFEPFTNAYRVARLPLRVHESD
jgi:hypothetical protein